jgi:hypothetical protein
MAMEGTGDLIVGRAVWAPALHAVVRKNRVERRIPFRTQPRDPFNETFRDEIEQGRRGDERGRTIERAFKISREIEL